MKSGRCQSFQIYYFNTGEEVQNKEADAEFTVGALIFWLTYLDADQNCWTFSLWVVFYAQQCLSRISAIATGLWNYLNVERASRD